jgi:large repetitive protein
MKPGALLLAAIAIGCGARSLDPGRGGGGLGAPGIDGGGTGADAVVRDVIAIEIIEPARCGDGIVDPGEQCDDGNMRSRDGCNPLCQIECNWSCRVCGDLPNPCVIAPCGNSWRDASEACDDGNRISGDGCAANCESVEGGWSCPVLGRRCVPICGDGRVVGPETCDDGNTAAGDGCSSICVAEPSGARCGDGVISGAEECDDGADNDGATYAGCTTDCRFGPSCGDGVLSGPEQCDLGDRNNTATFGDMAGCAPGCIYPHFCGDAIVDEDQGEQCDFGPNNGAPGQPCSTNCHILIDL